MPVPKYCLTCEYDIELLFIETLFWLRSNVDFPLKLMPNPISMLLSPRVVRNLIAQAAIIYGTWHIQEFKVIRFGYERGEFILDGRCDRCNDYD